MTAIDPRPIADWMRANQDADDIMGVLERAVLMVTDAMTAVGLTVVDTRDPATVVKVARAVWFSAGTSTQSTAVTVLDALR